MHRRNHLYRKNACEYRPETWKGTELADVGWAYLQLQKRFQIYLDNEISSHSGASRHGPYYKLHRRFSIDGNSLRCHPHPPGIPTSRLGAWSRAVPYRAKNEGPCFSSVLYACFLSQYVMYRSNTALEAWRLGYNQPQD